MPTLFRLSSFVSATPEADRLNCQASYFIIAAPAILGLVVALLVYIAIRFKAKQMPGNPKRGTTIPASGHQREPVLHLRYGYQPDSSIKRLSTLRPRLGNRVIIWPILVARSSTNPD